MSAVGRPKFVGNHQRNLDSKNRLTIPSKWRFDGDTDDVYLAYPSPSGSIHVLPPSRVEKLMDQMESHSLSDEEMAALQDRLFAHAHYFGCDKQGRFHMTDYLLKHAGITKEAIIAGRLSDFRIWSPEKWATIDPDQNKDDMAQIMKSAQI